jgi:microcystin-dependent protein
MQTPFIGQITFYPYNFPPRGWIECAGQLLPIQTYSALFSLIGTRFGGNGTSNFQLPNLSGSVPMGMGEPPGGAEYIIGETGGVETVTLVSNQLPPHNHALNATTAQGTVNNPAQAILASPYVGNRSGVQGTGQPYNPGAPNTTLVPTSLGFSGNGLPHNNIQPSLVLRPCIALTGAFPARN